MSMDNYVLGIDIGGTSIKIGVISNDNIVESTSIRNSFKGDFESLLPEIKGICGHLIGKYNLNKIGVGCPGDIIDGKLIFASNLGWKNIDLLKEFEKTFPNCEVKVDNDGLVSCNAEIIYGGLANVKDGLFVTIGKGVGGAIIIDHKILLGSNNYAGRFGHTIIKTGGRRCNCGRKGCYEAYASISGLIKTVKEYNAKWTKESEKIDVDKLSGFRILSYLNEKNKVVIEGVRRWHKDISEGLLNLCHITDPSTIIIAGGVTESELLDIGFVSEFLKKHGYGNCEVKLALLKGKTGLVGAASLFK